MFFSLLNRLYLRFKQNEDATSLPNTFLSWTIILRATKTYEIVIQDLLLIIWAIVSLFELLG
jgi:hypothetical protein